MDTSDLMKSNLSKTDIIWTYCSKSFTLVSGIITLPLILHMLSDEEIALNYLFINIISYTVIFDFGFSIQFSRNIAFAFGGSPDIKSVGFVNTEQGLINYRLVKNIIKSAQFLYGRIALCMLIVLLTAGTWYIKRMTAGYSLGNEVILMWVVFALFEAFDFFYKFYTPLLQGKGAIAELNEIEFITSIIKVIVTVALLYAGLRLWAVIIGVFSKILITRIMAVYVLFYKDGLKAKISEYTVSVEEKKEMIGKLWHNAKRSALVQIASFCNSHFGFLLAGLFLTSQDIASYGLLMQLVSILFGLSISLSNSVTPIYAQLRANGDFDGLRKNFYFTTGVYYILFIVGSITIVLLGPILLELIRSNAALPSLLIVSLFLFYKFLEGQHCICIYCISSKNKVYDTESAIIMAIATIMFQYVVLNYLHGGLIGIIVTQFIIAFVYANWKWPYELCQDFKISYLQMVVLSFREVCHVAMLKNLKR